MVRWFWTGAILPRYTRYPPVDALFYTRQVRWFWLAVYWGLTCLKSTSRT